MFPTGKFFLSRFFCPVVLASAKNIWDLLNKLKPQASTKYEKNVSIKLGKIFAWKAPVKENLKISSCFNFWKVDFRKEV